MTVCRICFDEREVCHRDILIFSLLYCCVLIILCVCVCVCVCVCGCVDVCGCVVIYGDEISSFLMTFCVVIYM